MDARAWTTGDGPKAIFTDALSWLVERDVLLPGLTTLTRLVARVRDQATARLWETLYQQLTETQRGLLEGLLVVGADAEVSDLERWRKGPVQPSGKSLERALARVSEITAVDLGGLDLDAVVPHRRLVELARYGMAAKAAQLRRHPAPRRLATLLATVAHLKASAVDDALKLLDLLVTTELVGKADREAKAERLRQHPRLARASATLAGVVHVVLDAMGKAEEEVGVHELWEAIEAVASRGEMAAAASTVNDLAPSYGGDDEEDVRAELAKRITMVSGFGKTLTETVDFEADAEAAPVLAVMKALPALLRGRRRLTRADIDQALVQGSWRDLVFGRRPAPDGAIDKGAYVLCVLTQFHRHLKRASIYAEASGRWRDPRSLLLAGRAWANAKDTVLTSLSLPEDPGELLARHARSLDDAYRNFAAGLADSTATVDDDGRLHTEALVAVPEPPSLVDLRRRVGAMLPRVDLPEVILEVMAWQPGFVEAFTAASGGRSRLADLHVSIAACLTAQALNIGYAPIVARGVEALEWDRISHVDQNYLGTETYVLANPFLVEDQAGIDLARAWGGGLVAAIDGMRFVVPVPSIYARPNRKYFGPKRGITWLNMLNDQGAGLGAKVVSGTARDSLHMIDVIFSQAGGRRPEVIVADAGSYSDVVFGLVNLLGMEYRPALADLPDQRLWRTDPVADYGPLNTAARGRLDLERVRRHWDDILRVVASIYTGSVAAYDVMRMLSREGRPTPLGEAIASYGRIFKSLHVLTYAADEVYRRDIKGIRNLQEGRHDLAATIFHGRKGELRQHYYKGMEDQLGALGLVLNCMVLWTTRYQDAALRQLRAAGYPVLDEDVARLSPFVRKHLNVHGRYSFALPELGGGLRELRDSETPEEEA